MPDSGIISLMTLDEIEEIVDQTIETLPEEFRLAMENVGLVVDLWPNEFEMESIKSHPGSLLFGLYQGIPKTKRTSNYSALPDKITIFAGPILMVSKDVEDARERIRKTVLHEIGHHFGLSDEELKKRNY